MDARYGTAADWEALVSKLNGVYAAHVVFSEEQQPLEIHVLASSRRNGKSLVRDVQSAISARYGIEVDYHIISIAQIAPDMMSGIRYRLNYAGIRMNSSEEGVEVTVTLTRGDARFTGTAIGSNLPFSKMRSIAQATLGAVKMCTNDTCFFELASTEPIRSNGREIIVTQVYCIPDLTPLIGCVYAQPDTDAAVVQSVLDAINRKLEVYTQEF